MNVKDCWYLGSCPLEPENCRETCLRFVEMRSLCEQSNLPEAKWYPQALLPGRDIDAFLRLRDIKTDIKQWVAEGNNLYLYSQNFGNGKTTWSIKLMLAFFNAVWAGNGFRRRAVFLSVPEFLDRSMNQISNNDPEFVRLRESLITCDLVVWDDIASSKLTDYKLSLLLNYIDARSNAKKSNIFTGNVNQEQMELIIGGRLTSRVWNASETIKFVDNDKRGRQIG